MLEIAEFPELSTASPHAPQTSGEVAQDGAGAHRNEVLHPRGWRTGDQRRGEGAGVGLGLAGACWTLGADGPDVAIVP